MIDRACLAAVAEIDLRGQVRQRQIQRKVRKTNALVRYQKFIAPKNLHDFQRWRFTTAGCMPY